ncbi:MAG: hypothetical protein R2873_11330 [Caldilineaceae bacterium]
MPAATHRRRRLRRRARQPINHHSMNNTAYAAGPVLGRFPSVWDGTPASEPSGPRHAAVLQYWLGKDETRELDADTMPDADGVTNILDNGANDVADNDKADDGWLNPDVPLIDCRERAQGADLKAAAPPAVDRLFLNVWFDGTATATGTASPAAPTRKPSPSVDRAGLGHQPRLDPRGGFIDIAVPAARPQPEAEADAWLRFTLSESPAVSDNTSAANLADGRGPAFPGFFKIGETEDYYRKARNPASLATSRSPSSTPPQPGGRGRRDHLQRHHHPRGRHRRLPPP